MTGGHPFEMEPFLDVFRALPGASAVSTCSRRRPGSCSGGSRPGAWDAIVCYDMQGIGFRKPEPPRFEHPPPDYASGIVEMLEAVRGSCSCTTRCRPGPRGRCGRRSSAAAGTTCLATWTGSSACRPGTPDPETQHHISASTRITRSARGQDGFDIVDEVYLNPVFGPDRPPILRTSYPMTPDALLLRAAGHHGPHVGPGRVEPSPRQRPGRLGQDRRRQPGRLPAARPRPHGLRQRGFRRLLANAIGWVASADAHEWARGRPRC